MINTERWQKRKKELGWTLDEIADKSGISRRTVARVFSGNPKYPDPSYNTVQSIDRALGLSTDITEEERAAGVVDTKKISISALEEDMLDVFRQIGARYGESGQRSYIEMGEKLLNLK